ncbi:MAG: multidrug efflux RND transporter permease subunit [Spongiibacteraceae bacterium]
MSVLAVFIRRPVATTLLTVAIALSGLVAFQLLPVASLPQIDFPNIDISARLPGANPETMAATVATPLERALGRIAGVEEMTSSSTQGSTRINVQFDLDRDIDGAARDVQAAINAAAGLLPTSLPSKPNYRKSNSSGGPMIVLALTSDTRTKQQLYDIGFTILGQKIAQVRGVGRVDVNGSSLPAVRVEANPTALNQYGIGLGEVRAALAAANVMLPVGAIEDGDRRWQIAINDQADKAAEYQDLIVAWRNGAPVFLRDVASISDSVQDLRNAGSFGGVPAVIIAVMSQPGENIVESVETIKAMLPQLQASIPSDVRLDIANDRTLTIRASLREVEHTLLISVALVVMVVYLFLRNGRATLIPTVAIPVSLLGTLTVIYLLGYSLNNLSLMALIIATGFVVDDAIVVVENVSRHIEKGMEPFAAALLGVREVGFTVLAMSVSLIAVFIPLLFMGGIVGHLFREFAVTLAVAVMISLLVSLTTTPMMCAHVLQRHPEPARGWLLRLHQLFEKFLSALTDSYRESLDWALRHGRLMLALLVATIGLNVFLFAVVPKGFFPQQDTGRIRGFIQADQRTSFPSVREKIAKLMAVLSADPDIETFYEFTGGQAGGQSNTGTAYAKLKPRAERDASAQEIVARLRPQLAQIPGGNLYLNPQQDIDIGGRSGGAQYQYTLLASDLDELRTWAPRVKDALNELPELTDVSSDLQDGGLQTSLVIDRAAAARLGLTASAIDSTLNDAFGQRLVSTIYAPLNQYYVVLTLNKEFASDTAALGLIHVKNTSGDMVPLSAFGRYETTNTPLAVNHEGQFAAVTLFFNLAPGVALGDASAAIDRSWQQIGVSSAVRGKFSGSAEAFKKTMSQQLWLIVAALVTAYIVLGILYESLVHPLTILSTLPSAGVGAVIALIVCRSELSIIASIGIFLLIGIVMKNAILMIDFALQVEREQGLSSREAIYQACLMRFRPILMTTSAAMLGALPLALALGDGSELRRPLGISIVGGLLFSQLLTLYTTPIVYLYLDRLQLYLTHRWQRRALKFPLPAEEREITTVTGSTNVSG